MILAGDIGGTSTRLGFYEVRQGRLHPLLEQIYSSRKHAGLQEIAMAFVKANSLRVEHACFGIAGPVIHGRVSTPNLPWTIDVKILSSDLGLKVVSLINDLEANAYGIDALEPTDLVLLQSGAVRPTGNTAVIAAGTGLGEAGLFWDGRWHNPFACEGGHADFAPRNELEIELLRHLLGRFGRVSYERVLSGPGLLNIFEFLRDTKRGTVPRELAEELKQGDRSAVISRNGLEARYPICVEALDMFVSVYGAEAGNLALKTMATGGVYVGGGIAPRILAKLKTPIFLEAFTQKGRMQPLLGSIPVWVILNDRTALLGAARCAARVAELL